MTDPRIGANSSVPKHIQNELIRCEAMGEFPPISEEERLYVNEIIRKSVESYRKQTSEVL